MIPTTFQQTKSLCTRPVSVRKFLPTRDVHKPSDDDKNGEDGQDHKNNSMEYSGLSFAQMADKVCIGVPKFWHIHLVLTLSLVRLGLC